MSTIDYYEGRKNAYKEIADMIQDFQDMDGIDKNSATIICNYLEDKINRCNNIISSLLEDMLENERGKLNG